MRVLSHPVIGVMLAVYTVGCSIGDETGAGASAAASELPEGVTVLARDQQPSLSNLVVDADFAYWGNDDAVMKVAIRGGSPEVVVSGLRSPRYLALDSEFVYFTNYHGGSVMKVAKHGGAPTTLAAQQGEPTGIAVDREYVYWASSFSPSSSVGPSIQKVPRAGGQSTLLTAGAIGPDSVVVDATSVYWVSNGSGIVTNGAVMKVPLMGGERVVLAHGFTAGSNALALDGKYVYFADIEGNVMSVAIAGGVTRTLASGGERSLGVASGIAADDSDIYWTTVNTGALWKAPLAGGDAIKLDVGGLTGPYAVALDRRAVYWSDLGGAIAMQRK